MARDCSCRRRTPARASAEYARPFDTVYVSLYKYFNAASGAILAGPKDVIDGMYHGRRMFGGGLNAAWPFALVALHYLDGFERALRPGGADFRGLDPRSAAARGASRSIASRPARTCSACASEASTRRRFRSGSPRDGVMLPAPQRDTFLVGVNETLNRTTASDLSGAFVRAAAV